MAVYVWHIRFAEQDDPTERQAGENKHWDVLAENFGTAYEFSNCSRNGRG